MIRPENYDWKSDYYDGAENNAAAHWSWYIAPRLLPFCAGGGMDPRTSAELKELAAAAAKRGITIPVFDLASVLDFACGQGRMSEHLQPLAGTLYCCDINEEAIKYCHRRFAEKGKTVSCVRNDVSGIPLDDESLTFIFSMDSMVHFEIEAISLYLKEFRRLLRPGGGGFIHHSNYAGLADKPRTPWHLNPGHRAYTSAADIADVCKDLGLTVLSQELIAWEGQPEHLDCFTMFRKPA